MLTPSFPAMPGQSVLVHVAASSLAPITGLTLTIGGQPVTLDGQGRATYYAAAPGRIAIAATATDGDGLVGQFADRAQGAATRTTRSRRASPSARSSPTRG